MTLFQPSTKAVSAAAQEIADSVGASGDGEMTARAGRSLFAAIQHFNNKSKWHFLLSESTPATVYAPFTVTGVTASAGQASAACPAGHGIKPYDFVAGSGFAQGVRVSATAASGFGFYGSITGYSTSATADLSFTRDMYDLPSDYKAMYSARLLTTQRTLRYVGRRLYDRSIDNEQQVSTTTWYDLFMVGAAGKVRLLTPPSTSDILFMRYFRRMTDPTTTATADVLDIPQDYEPYLLAWAKWHFLTDKGESRKDQAQTWFALGEEGLKTMLSDQSNKPDEDLMLLPGQYQYGSISDRSTTWIDWSYSG